MSTLSEQERATETRRPYRMRKRAEQVDQTRQRIVEAAVRLHETIGPARTTITGIAEEAGVTRLTVYRHFPDEQQLFATCTSHWSMLHPAPDPAEWRTVRGIEARARRALTELYPWFRTNADALYLFQRDAEVLPEWVREELRAENVQMAESLVSGAGLRSRAAARLHAAAGHVVSYGTWRSLALEQGVSDEDAVDLAIRFLCAAMDP